MAYFAELKQEDPKRYAQLEAKAKELGYIRPDQELVDLDRDPRRRWLRDWAEAETLNLDVAGASRRAVTNQVAAGANRYRRR